MVRIVALAAAHFYELASPLAAEGKRVALIIGNSDYKNLSSLGNPVADAKAIAAALKQHGFEVSENYNLDRADLLDALESFQREAQGAEVALVYYAGHGMEVDGKNVVAPTDMEIDCKDKKSLGASSSTNYLRPRRPRRNRSCCSMPAATIHSRNARRAARARGAASGDSRG